MTLLGGLNGSLTVHARVPGIGLQTGPAAGNGPPLGIEGIKYKPPAKSVRTIVEINNRASPHPIFTRLLTLLMPPAYYRSMASDSEIHQKDSRHKFYEV